MLAAATPYLIASSAWQPDPEKVLVDNHISFVLAVAQGSDGDLEPQQSGPDWEYDTPGPPPSSHSDLLPPATAADSPAAPTTDADYNASYHVYHNAAATESLDGKFSPSLCISAA